LYCDYLISQNGKWRSSKKARQLGPHAVALEKLVYRDGYTLDQAVAVLESQERKCNGSELRDGFWEIPRRRACVSVESEALLEKQPDTRPSVYEVLCQQEIARASRDVRSALSDSLAELAEDDRRVLELRFLQGLRMPEISRRLGLRERSVYSRYYRILHVLRAKLEARRVHHGVLIDMLGGTFDFQEIEGVLATGGVQSLVNSPTLAVSACEGELLSV
jgi:RNA polymerase sigma factor (sigma-70 family)